MISLSTKVSGEPGPAEAGGPRSFTLPLNVGCDLIV